MEVEMIKLERLRDLVIVGGWREKKSLSDIKIQNIYV